MTDQRANTWDSVAPRTLTILVLVASAVGLLSVPIGSYDDSLMLVGTRLVGSGKRPYIDFYTHYGPLGYTILSWLVRLSGDPGLALRIGEIALLAGIAILMHVFFRSVQPQSSLLEYAVPLLIAVLSQIAMQPFFFGFGFTMAALVLFLLSRNAVRKPTAIPLNVGAGAALAAAVLTRPAFAAYGAGALLLLEAGAGRPRFGDSRDPLSTIGVFFGGAAFATLVTWLFLYSTISPALAFNATIVTPARLVGAGGRYLDPDFLRAAGTNGPGLIRAVATGAALVATTIAWTIAVSRRKAFRLIVSCLAAGGILPLLLTVSEHPARDAGLLALTMFVLAGSVAVVARSALQESALLRASATFGLAAAAFEHYFWARADSTHLAPALALALVGAALLLPSLRAMGRIALFSVFVFTYGSALQYFFFPAVTLLKHDIITSLLPWRCTVFPTDARDAVAFADSQARPGSRFVAVGSSQAWSSGNPIELFLISSRLPYTRWFQYDPGLQSSAAVQKEMQRDLQDSGSRTAVVWKAEQYLFDRERPSRKARSPFDDFFDRLYPTTAARFGNYAVRMRASGASASSSGSPDVRP